MGREGKGRAVGKKEGGGWWRFADDVSDVSCTLHPRTLRPKKAIKLCENILDYWGILLTACFGLTLGVSAL